MLRSGLLLVLLGALHNVFFATAIVSVWGQEGINTGVFSYASQLLLVLEPLGVGLVVFSLVARHCEDESVPDQPDLDDDLAVTSWKPTPRQTLVAGVALLLVGLLINVSSYDWLYDVNSGLLRDFLVYVALPLKDAIFLAGILLIPCSLVIRIMSMRTDWGRDAGGGQSAAARVP